MGQRLHPDSGFNQGLFVAYNEKGQVNKQGYLTVDEYGIVHFVDILTDAQRPGTSDPAA